MNKLLVIGIAAAFLGITAFITILLLIRAPEPDAGEGLFVVSRTNTDETEQRLLDLGYVKSRWSLNAARITSFRFNDVKPGGYKLSKAMDARKLIGILTSEPQLKWITIPEGLRKEEIGERLGKELNWSGEELEKWKTTYTAMEFDYREGVYFPDTYLIPTDENGLATAKRMTIRFNERFASNPYFKSWT